MKDNTVVAFEEQLTSSNLHLQGRWLALARLGWLLSALLSLSLLVLGTTAQYHRISVPCADIPINEQPDCWPTELALSQLGYTWNDLAKYATATSLFAIVPLLSIGGYIFWRKSADPFCLLFSLGMVAFGSVVVNQNLIQDLLIAYPNLSVPIEIGDLLGVLFIGLIPFLIPDGRFVPRWTRWLAGLWISRSLYFVSIRLVPQSENPIATTVIFLLIFPYLAANVYAMIYRYRHDANPTQRQQIKWVVLAGVIVIPISGGFFALSQFYQPGFFELFLVGIYIPIYYLSFLLTAVCLGVSILRYRLWDIDLIIRKTVLWAIVSGLGLAVYLLAVGATSYLFSSQTDYVIPLVALIGVAFIARPLYRRLERGLERIWPVKREETEQQGEG